MSTLYTKLKPFARSLWRKVHMPPHFFTYTHFLIMHTFNSLFTSNIQNTNSSKRLKNCHSPVFIPCHIMVQSFIHQPPHLVILWSIRLFASLHTLSHYGLFVYSPASIYLVPLWSLRLFTSHHTLSHYGLFVCTQEKALIWFLSPAAFLFARQFANLVFI